MSQTAKKSGKRSGRSNYTAEEIQHFLAIMEEVLPIGPDEWDRVLVEHSNLFPNRDVESLRRKYHTLHRKKIPTGDPSMPLEVKMAKRIKYKIGERANLGDGEEGFDLATGEFNNDAAEESKDSSDDDNQPETTTADDGATETSPNDNGETPNNDNNDSTTPADRSAASSLSTPTGGRSSRALRPRSSPTPRDDFMELMKMQMMQEREDRREERLEKAEDRKALTAVLTAAVAGFVQAMATKKPRKRKRGHHSQESDVDSDSS